MVKFKILISLKVLIALTTVNLLFFVGRSYNDEKDYRPASSSVRHSKKAMKKIVQDHAIRNEEGLKIIANNSMKMSHTSDGDKNEFEDMFRRRSEEMKRICSTEVSPRTRDSPINSREFLINTQFGLTWCNIFKAASSSWFELFLKLANRKKKQSESRVGAARKVYPRPSVEELKNVLANNRYKSVVILREPFERILSSYISKLTNTLSKFYHTVRCSMAQLDPTKSKACYPTFPQYVDYIVRRYVTGAHMDEHWHPYSTFCSLCQVNYDYILRFENIEEEQNYILEFGVPSLSGYDIGHWNPSHQQSFSQLVSDLYSQLSREQLNQLVEIYRDDFLLSGHSWQKYYELIED